jgi:hypothetical protein
MNKEQIELITWLGINCQCELKSVNKAYNYYWAFKKDMASLWDGIGDDRLKWYTHEQIYDIYLASELNTAENEI